MTSSLNEFARLLPDLLTTKEKIILRRRFKIINLLKQDLSYREIAVVLGISTTTVVRINKRLGIRKGKRKNHGLDNKVSQGVKIPWKIG